MSRRGAHLFRGAELPRVLAMLALAAVCLPLILSASRRDHRDAPGSRRADAADVPPLPPPDPDPAFRGILDKTPLSFRDTAAYALLLDRVRRTPPAELARQGRDDVRFSQLIEHPERFRGVPIHVEGTARRVLWHEVDDPRLSATGRLFEAWTFPTDSQNNPMVLVFEGPPEGLPVGDNLHEQVVFDGYFLKLLAYVAGDKPRFAPMLVGRLGHVAEAAPAPGLWGTGMSYWALVPLALLVGYIVVRWGYFTRGMVAPRQILRRPPPNDQISPEALEDWVESAGHGDLDREDGSGEFPTA